MKALLRALFASTLADLDPAWRVAAALHGRADAWRGARRLRVLALGKAARRMAAGAQQALAGSGLAIDGLVVPPTGDAGPLPPFEVVAGGHPLPSAGSLRAGARALELCRTANADTFVLLLLSGGASAMCELPIDPAVTLAELQACHRALVGSGAGIGEINTVRKHLSAVKGGRLAAAAAGARGLLTLAVSDVPGDPAALASGPTLGDRATLADCRRIVQQWGLGGALPERLRVALEAGSLPPLPRPDDPALARSTFEVLLDNQDALRALAAHAAARGLAVDIVRDADELPVDDAAALLLGRLQPGRALLAGGEVRVALPQEHGLGGRNQQFALACALRIQDQPIAVLSCGTDGIDGCSPAAGAVADGTTVARARELGLDAADHLRRCDALPLFERLGDLVVTGPTGTNVRDLRVLVRLSAG